MNKFKILGIGFFMFFMNILYGQTTCNTAVTQNIGTAVEYNLTNNEYWIKFNSDTTFINVKLYRANNTPASQLVSIELFSGTCTSLNLLSSMNLSDSTLINSNLIKGNTYFLKLTQSQSISSYSGIMLAAPVNNVPINCPTACNLVPNGCFNESSINVDLMQYFNNGTNSSVYNYPLFSFGQYTNALSNVCGWYNYNSSPQLKREVIANGYNYYMFLMAYNNASGGKTYEEIVSELNNGNNLNPDEYILRYKHKDINGHTNKVKLYLCNSPNYNINYQSSSILIDDKNVTSSTWKQEEKLINIAANQTSYKYLIVHPEDDGSACMLGIDDIHLLSYTVSVSPNTICSGDNSTLTANLCNDICPEENFSVAYNWISNPIDPSLTGQETQSSITVSPTVTTTYTATATTNLGTIITKSKVITVNPTPNTPVFNGDIHTCNGISNYGISNYDANATYTCTVYDDNMNPLGNPTVSGNNFTINWTNYGAFSHWTIQLEAAYGTGCSSISTLDVFPCCTNGTTFTDTYLSGTFSNQNLAFNGTITVPAGNNLEINTNSQVYMGGNAKIVLESGATFDLINSSIEACGNNMWDGIFIGDPSTIFISTNSQIYDAKNAVVSNKGGDYTIEQSTFERNYIAIQVNNYIGDHNGEVSNSNFYGSNNLLYPYQNVQSKSAFDLNNVIKKTKLIRIGSINGRNNIHGFENCVSAKNSDFVAFALDVADCVTGVNIVGNDNDPNNRRAIVGSSNQGFNCTFNDVNYVVDAYSKSDIYIYKNEANTCSFGAYIEHNKGSIISILGNTFNSMGEGISILDISSEIYIQNNTISLTNGQGGSSLMGIRVLDNGYGSSITPTTYICDNDISNAKYSILANNAYDLQIIHNTVNQNSIATSLAIGILSTNNNSPVIGDNHIESPSSITLNAGMLNLRHGIYTNYSDYGRFINNESIHNGSGIYFRKVNTNIEIGLNKVTDNWDGMYFENADIGPNPQGQLNDPWNNEWSSTNPNIHTNMDGNISQSIDWYHQGGAPFDPTLVPFAPVNINFIPTSNGAYNPLLKCTAGPVNPPGGVNNDLDGAFIAAGYLTTSTLTTSQKDSIRTTKLGGIISMFVPLSLSGTLNASTTASMLSGANIYQNNSNVVYNKCRAAYRYLSKNKSYLSIGIAGDNVYQGFYTWLDNSNIGKLDKVEKAVFGGDTTTANSLLNSLAPQNFIEIVSQEVFSIYNRSWAIGKYSFISSDSTTLLNIAYLDPANGGPSVYLARNMLGLTLVEFGQNQVAREANTAITDSKAKEDNSIFVYPNPATNQITVEFDKQIKNCEITIYNIFGQEIIHHQLNGNTKYNLNISELESGMYFYSIVSDGNVLKSDKFIKQ